MPNYSYRCPDCNVTWEQHQPVETRDEVRCGECGQQAQRQFNAPGIAFKGAGFYTTDKGK